LLLLLLLDNILRAITCCSKIRLLRFVTITLILVASYAATRSVTPAACTGKSTIF
jgi:hypothetical protein